MKRRYLDASADISSCGRYRYRLWRALDGVANRRVVFVMHNPSTADGVQDDATIRRCVSFAERHRYSCLDVVNLFAFRATDPRELLRARDAGLGLDVVGPDNDYAIRSAVADACLVVAAWGTPRWPWVQGRADNVALIVKQARARWRSVPMFALGFTKDGHPRHPLYLPRDAMARPYDVAEWRPA